MREASEIIILKNCLIIFWGSIILFFAPTVSAQKKVDYAALYPEEKAIFLKRSKKIHLTLKKGKISVRSEVFSEILHLKAQSAELALESVRFSQFVKISNIEAYTLTTESEGRKKIPAGNFQTNDIISEDVFYNDEKEISFTYPGVSPGARTILRYTEELSDAHFLGGFAFSSYLPCIESETEIFADKDILLGSKIFNGEMIEVEDEKGIFKQKFRYRMSHVLPQNFIENAPSSAYFEPHIWFFVRGFYEKGKFNSFLNDINDLYSWYYGFIKNVNRADSRPLQNFADSLCKNAKNAEDKAKLIFLWVQNHIKYVAFEQGLRGFTPEIPEKVFEKRYGDCKDMSSLLVALLRNASLKAHFAWVGTRDLPYRYEELPSPAVDDHVIVVVFLENKILFLDATSPYVPFGMPTAFIQGKEALVAISEKNYQILPVPVARSRQNIISDSVHLHIKKDKLLAHGVYAMQGYPRVIFTEHIAENSENQLKSIKRLFQGENKILDSLQYDFENFEENNRPLLLNYYWETAHYHKSVRGEIYVNMHLHPLWKNKNLREERKIPVETRYHFEQRSCVILHIPDGYRVSSLPEKTAFESDEFFFEIRYEKQNNTVVMRSTIRGSFLILQPKMFKKWNEMTELLNSAYRRSILLEGNP
jgi:hypothetical protein